MNRTAARLFAGAATAALASALVVSAASAATATITIPSRLPSSPVLAPDGSVEIEGTISATASVAGTVAFMVDGTVIKGCEAVATTPSGTSFTALCSGWKPTAAVTVSLTATLTPTDTTIAKVTSAPVAHAVGKPINDYVKEPISIYVDTVNGTGPGANISTSAGGPAYNAVTGCVILNQFVQGQMIVFRVYATDFSRNAPVTGKDATMEIKVAGWDTAIKMSYGNHSGTAFWAGALSTGTAGSGKFSTVGSITYKVNITLIEKPAVTKETMATKYVKVIDKKTKKPVKVNGTYVWKPVKVKATEIVTPAVLGRTVSFDSTAWGPTSSNLTLSAAPAAK